MKSKNRVRSLYKGYDKSLKPYKREMIEIMQNDKAFAVAIIETWRASKFRKQYFETIGYFGFNHKNAYSEFCKTNIIGKGLTGRDGFWNTVRMCGYGNIYEKYKNSIPESKAMGMVLGVAFKIINGHI